MIGIRKFIKAEFKRSNAKAFLFFLFFATILWLLLQFSKTYTEIIDVSITYNNYPKDKLIEEKGSNISLEVEQNGFQLAWINLFKHNINVDLSDLPVDSSALKLDITDYKLELSRKLSLDMTQTNFLDKEILIPFDLKSTKRVPIISRIKANYAPGFSSETPPVINPDSVTISGPSSILDTIPSVFTENVTEKGIDRNMTSRVKLEEIDPKVTLYEKEIDWRVEVQKFTEGKVKVPLSVINLPPNVDLSLFPANVEVTYMVSVEKYDLVKIDDFKLICDYNEISEDQNFFIVKLQKKPDFIKNVMISPKKAHYIIKK